MEKVKASQGNAKKLDDLGPIHIHVWAAVIRADLEPVLDSLERALLATGGKRKHGQAPRGGLERQLQEMLDVLH